MCGIAGSIGRGISDKGLITKTLSLMKNRGPDYEGMYKGDLNGKKLLFLHSRLSIIDIDKRSNQPFIENGHVLIFNGEIYNYIELKNELEMLGHVFRTNSDTEVIVKCYKQYGKKCVNRFEGMWAFALFDNNKKEVFLSRDRFGEKPLFYKIINNTFYFGSEPKFISSLSNSKLNINSNHLKRYLVNGFRSIFKTEETFYEDLYELQPAMNMIIKTPDNISKKKYWRLKYSPVSMSLSDAEEQTNEYLLNSLKLRLRSDVPVAFCLSGGVDSTTLAVIAAKIYGQKLHAFSVIDNDKRYDERQNINTVVDELGCEHHNIYTTTDGFLERMKSIVDYHDAPVPTISYYVHNFLSESIKEAGYSVAISGTGADEVFTGYYDHYAFWLAYMSNHNDFEKMLAMWQEGYGKYINNPLLKEPLNFVHNPLSREHLYQNRDLFNGFLKTSFDECFDEEVYTTDILRNRMMNELTHEVVPVILRADDSNSMMWSVENRSPYLDSSLVEFLYTVPNEHLIVNGYQKWLLRASGKNLLPDSVRLDKQKRGFNTSIDSLLDRNDPDVRDWLMEDSSIFDLVNKSSIENMLTKDLTDNSFSKFMFGFVSAKIFVDNNVNNSKFIN
tara:strand:+ start:1787 stop:3628 length:1842 start_codon:yes stop_codon:yes gene_type:complete